MSIVIDPLFSQQLSSPLSQAKVITEEKKNNKDQELKFVYTLTLQTLGFEEHRYVLYTKNQIWDQFNLSYTEYQIMVRLGKFNIV